MEIHAILNKTEKKIYHLSSRSLKCGDGYKEYKKHIVFLDSEEDFDLYIKFIKLFTNNFKILDSKRILIFSSSTNYQIFLFRITRYIRNEDFKKIIRCTIDSFKSEKLSPYDALIFSVLVNLNSNTSGYNVGMDIFSTQNERNLHTASTKLEIVQNLINSYSYNYFFNNEKNKKIKSKSISFYTLSNSLRRQKKEDKLNFFIENHLPLLIENKKEIF